MKTYATREEAQAACDELQADAERSELTKGKWRLSVSGLDPVNQDYVIVATPLWNHGWTMPGVLNRRQIKHD